MAIRRKDFITEVLTDTDLEAVQDNANIQVDTVAELNSLPASVNTAYVKADESIYIRRASAWIKLAKEVSVSAGTGLSGGGSLNADRTLSLNTSYTDGRYIKASGETRVIATSEQVRAQDFVAYGLNGHAYTYFIPAGSNGWRIGQDGGAGNSFVISRTTNLGGWLNNVVSINPSTGQVYVGNALHAQGGIYLTDSTVPPEPIPGTNDMRFLYYDGTGRLRRCNIDTMRFIIAASTVNFKTNVTETDDVPDVTKLSPVSFKWKPDAPVADASSEEGNQLGLIAEDVEQLDKRLVWHDSEGKAAGLNYSALITALIAKVTELEKRIEELEAK